MQFAVWQASSTAHNASKPRRKPIARHIFANSHNSVPALYESYGNSNKPQQTTRNSGRDAMEHWHSVSPLHKSITDCGFFSEGGFCSEHSAFWPPPPPNETISQRRDKKITWCIMPLALYTHGNNIAARSRSVSLRLSKRDINRVAFQRRQFNLKFVGLGPCAPVVLYPNPTLPRWNFPPFVYTCCCVISFPLQILRLDFAFSLKVHTRVNFLDDSTELMKNE